MKILRIIAVIAVALSASLGGWARPQRKVSESVAFARRLGMGINIGNSLDAHHNGIADETCWGNGKITQWTLDNLAGAGFRTVRIPVTWMGHIGEAPEYRINPERMNRVKEVVGYARKAGFTVIINTHHDGANSASWLDIKGAARDEAVARRVKEQIRAVWTQIAEAFRDEGEYLMFESFNEIQDGKWGWGGNRTDGGRQYAVLNEWNQTFVDAVRATKGKNSRRFLGVPGYSTNIDLTVAHFVMPHDPAERTLVSVHCYDPYLFTLECKYNQWGSRADKDKVAPGGDEAALRSQMELLSTHFIQKGIGVYVGEMGAAHRSNEEDEQFRCDYLRYICGLGGEYGIPMIYWENGTRGSGRECEGLFDHSTGLFFNNGLEIARLMIQAYQNR